MVDATGINPDQSLDRLRVYLECTQDLAATQLQQLDIWRNTLGETPTWQVADRQSTYTIAGNVAVANTYCNSLREQGYRLNAHYCGRIATIRSIEYAVRPTAGYLLQVVGDPERFWPLAESSLQIIEPLSRQIFLGQPQNAGGLRNPYEPLLIPHKTGVQAML
jgi:hypothetical protein